MMELVRDSRELTNQTPTSMVKKGLHKKLGLIPKLPLEHAIKSSAENLRQKRMKNYHILDSNSIRLSGFVDEHSDSKLSFQKSKDGRFDTIANAGTVVQDHIG